MQHDEKDDGASLLRVDGLASPTDTVALPNRLGIKGLRPVDPAVVREFERAMTEEVIPQTVEALREREIAWNQIKDRSLTSWTPEYLAAKAEEAALVVGLRANGEVTAADTIVKLRADFETEREMHNAWRKRAEESEAREVARLTGDCPYCVPDEALRAHIKARFGSETV